MSHKQSNPEQQPQQAQKSLRIKPPKRNKDRFLIFSSEQRAKLKEQHNELIKNKTRKNYTKKPIAAYGVFIREMKDIIRKEMSAEKLLMADILRIIGILWGKLRQEEKTSYFEERSDHEKKLKGVIQSNEKSRRRRNLSPKDLADQQSMPKSTKKVKGSSRTPPSKISTLEREEEEEVKIETVSSNENRRSGIQIQEVLAAAVVPQNISNLDFES